MDRRPRSIDYAKLVAEKLDELIGRVVMPIIVSVGNVTPYYVVSQMVPGLYFKCGEKAEIYIQVEMIVLDLVQSRYLTEWRDNNLAERNNKTSKLPAKVTLNTCARIYQQADFNQHADLAWGCVLWCTGGALRM